MRVSIKTPTAITIVYRLLLVLLVFLVIILLGVTVYAFFFRDEDAAFKAPSSPSSALNAAPASEAHIFTGIGRLRLLTADESVANLPEAPIMVIITVSFPYTPEDLAFSEELAARVRDFRTLTESYFGSIKAADLRNMREDQIKADLLERYNSVLRLGKIGTLYFRDFMFLDWGVGSREWGGGRGEWGVGSGE
jgi:flagellar basal body-associated protein FliL